MFYRYNCNISKTLHELGNYCNYLTLLHFHVTIKYQKAQKNLKDIVSLRFEKVAASYSPALHCSTIGAILSLNIDHSPLNITCPNARPLPTYG